MPSSPRPSRRNALGLAALAALAVPLAACTPQDQNVTDNAKDGSNKGYVAGDGSVQEYKGSERGRPVEFSGVDFDGKTIDAASLRGKPAVLNFWYAACAPCRTEAPTLKKVSEEFSKQGVAFVGVNVRDEKAAAESFDRTFGLTYPSIRDLDGGVLLSLADFVPPQAVPTTLVLDAQGRVTARVLGVVEESTLRSLVKTAAEEQA